MRTSRFPRIIHSILAVITLLTVAQICGAQSAAPTTAPAVPISRVDASKYTVEGNIHYGSSPQQVVDMIYPKGAAGSAKLPGVVMFHGGGWIQTNKATMSTFYNRFLAHGFVVCNVEYRMATKDKATGNYTPNSAVAPAAVQDALAATKWFWDHADQYHVDKSRFIVTGASAGGHLAVMVGLCTPAADLGPTSPADFKIAAIVNGYGTVDVADLVRRNDPATKQWLPDSIPDRDELAKRVSPMTYLRKDVSPLFTVIGSKDRGLAANQRMIDLLKKDGADADLHVVDGAGHGFATPPTAWPDAEQAIFSFLTQKKIISQGRGAGAG